METYEVVGPRVVDGHKPGEKYQDDYPAEKIALLVQSGHIRVVQANIAELRAAAAAAGIEGADELKKADLLEALAASAPDPAPPDEGGDIKQPEGAYEAPFVVKEA